MLKLKKMTNDDYDFNDDAVISNFLSDLTSEIEYMRKMGFTKTEVRYYALGMSRYLFISMNDKDFVRTEISKIISKYYST